jgi:hypothetical protein
VHGLSVALVVAAVIALAGAVVAAATVRTHVDPADVPERVPARALRLRDRPERA